MFHLSVAGFSSLFWVANLTDAIANERPNIVIRLADDLGADVGYHGSDIETPAVRQEVKLNRFYAAILLAYVLMTGRDPLNSALLILFSCLGRMAASL